ncbi:serine/threonine-protein phosphatase 6 regulatory ankyrin repeat subunit B-like [Halyomorpha halys]|uniref:serine/threonine-protein phosphatase 6 regulatory ankyrin repeat subunit B-like n=1 Tax=Halyomorpha halys TaxID=286706 RepID=UPI0006D4E054
MLIKAGAEIDAADVVGMTPLHFAARERYQKVVRSIINFGALVDSRNENGSTPLHLACEWSTKFTEVEQLEIVDNLIFRGADIHTTDLNKMTPLHLASMGNHSTIIYVLLLYKADLSRRDALLNQPIHYAALYGRSKVIFELLMKGKEMTESVSVNKDQETPLFIASREGHTKVVAMLLQAGVESLQPDVKGRTALHRSAARGHSTIVKILRQALLNINKEDKWGFTALNYAASWKGHQEVIGYLSTTQLNITTSYYLQKSLPHQNILKNQISLSVQKLPGVKLGIPYSFKIGTENVIKYINYEDWENESNITCATTHSNCHAFGISLLGTMNEKLP